MKQFFFTILTMFLFALVGCSNENKNPAYTQSELETFLIRDCNKAEYIFKDEDLEYEFNFKKTSKGNAGKYIKYHLTNNKYKDYDFIWEVEPNNDGGIVTMAFDKEKERIRVPMFLTVEKYTSIIIRQDGSSEELITTKELWKLDFAPKDDPFN